MTDPANYGFIPWVRRGLASLAQPASGANYLTTQVALTVNATAAAPVSVRLHGPGQITGIDPHAIVRTEPRANTTTFEPNYFPAVEFATADFPWLFTPATPAGTMLRPWLCLVVVREQAGITLVPRPRALPLLQFTAPAVPLDELPNLDQIAAWAHAQIIGGATDTNAVQTALDGPAGAYVSRIICPRRLAPSTSYLACLVPTYRVGMQIGTSPTLPVNDLDLAPAWDSTLAAPFALPVYASWRFATASDGDFASLARRMRPPTEPLQLGLRDMDIGAPGFGLPAFPGLVLGLEGALRSPETVPTAWPPGVQAHFEQALTPILAPAPAPVPIVTAPVYGQVPANAPLPPAGGGPLWLRELNLDPRARAAAGMGSEIVRTDQEALMASAWDQYEAIRRANQLLRQMQLARSVTAATRTRQFGTVDGAGTLLQLTRPLHARVRLDPSSPLTLDAQVGASSVAPGAVSAAFRRLARRGGPVGRRLYSAGTPSRIVERLNLVANTVGAITIAPPRVPPQGVVLLETVSAQMTVAELSPTVVARAAGWAVAGATTVLASGSLTTPVASVTPTPAASVGTPTSPGLVKTVATGPLAAAAPAAVPPSASLTTHTAATLVPAIAVAGAIGATSASATTSASAATGTVAVHAGDAVAIRPIGTITGVLLPTAPALPIDLAANKAMAMRFRAAANAVTSYISTRTAQIVDPPANPPLAATLTLVRTLAFQAVDPAVTIVARARARLTLPTTGDPLRPLLGAPVFPQPMSRELQPRQLLPGVDRVPSETAAMLVTNPHFIEAFMVGLNDEMRRELAWRQYPTDQRGTFFSHFWTTGSAAKATDDIPPITTWNPSRHLGDNATVQGEQVVLLLRGELLRRYPNTIISAVQAQAGPNNVRTLSATELFPVFSGAIAPDMVFFGFALTEAVATAGAGWYFVLAEHPTEPRFGFEPAPVTGPLTTWNDLAWPQVPLKHNHVDLSAPAPSGPLEGATWNTSSAEQAFISFRRPIRLALHATTLLG